METKELIKKVRKVEIKTKGLSKHLFSGEYHSAFKGRGMSFSEVRNYLYGDDVRSIDWNVTARTGTPHVKVFEEERELTVMLMVDISQSSFFGTESQFKNELITEICAVLAFSAIQNNDKVGAILFTDRIERYIPPKKGKKHILLIIRELIQHEAQDVGTNIKAALEYFNNVIKKRSIAFLISDFYADSYDVALSIAARKHDLVGLHIYDKMEKYLPKMGLIRMVDPETGERLLVDTDSEALRQDFHERFLRHFKGLEDQFWRSGADILHIQTSESYIRVLLNFFKRRSR
jgi:uncharacterized protein (DUF58 family)